MHSCIYEGHVRHRRFQPVTNAFRYRLFLMFVDLAELPTLFDGDPLWSSHRFNAAFFRKGITWGILVCRWMKRFGSWSLIT